MGRDPWNLWKNGQLEDKRIVLKLTLAEQLEYDWNDGVRTAELSMPFKVLLGNCDYKNELADRETRKSVRQIVSKALDFLLII